MIAYLVDLEFLGEDSDYLSIEEVEVEEITDKDVVVLAGGHTRCRVSRFQSDRLYFRTKEAATKVLTALLEDDHQNEDTECEIIVGSLIWGEVAEFNQESDKDE